MRILMVGDVVGKPGRNLALSAIPRLRKSLGVDFAVVNGENAAGGIGITPDIAQALLTHGADVITLGNHAWGKRDIYTYLDSEPRILRPHNFPPGVPGRGFGVFSAPESAVCVAAFQCRTFMEPIDDPFRLVDSMLDEVASRTRVIFIDLHGEATSEKIAFGWYVDGRVSAVVGTHTHVQTADERILPGGTAYLTDVGMTGPVDSVIGMDREIVLSKFTTGMPARFEVADGEAQLCAVVIDVDIASGRSTAIHRVQTPTHDEIAAARANKEENS